MLLCDLFKALVVANVANFHSMILSLSNNQKLFIFPYYHKDLFRKVLKVGNLVVLIKKSI